MGSGEATWQARVAKCVPCMLLGFLLTTSIWLAPRASRSHSSANHGAPKAIQIGARSAHGKLGHAVLVQRVTLVPLCIAHVAKATATIPTRTGIPSVVGQAKTVVDVPLAATRLLSAFSP